jgi:hypothetical protein
VSKPWYAPYPSADAYFEEDAENYAAAMENMTAAALERSNGSRRATSPADPFSR